MISHQALVIDESEKEAGELMVDDSDSPSPPPQLFILNLDPLVSRRLSNINKTKSRQRDATCTMES